MITTPVLNVDTGRISQLAESPADGEWKDLVDTLSRGDAYIVVCLTRIHELSRLSAQRRATVVSFLRQVPTLIGQPEDVLEEDELACACASAAGLSRRAPQPFARTSDSWGTAFQAPGGTAADLLEVWDPTSPEVQVLASLGPLHIRLAQGLAQPAAVTTDRAVHLRAALQHHLARWRASSRDYGANLSAQEVIDRVGGLEAFPAFRVVADLLAARLGREHAGHANDLFDENIARYHPYCAVSVFDRATANRFREAKIAGGERVTHRLGEVMTLLGAGSSSVTPFYLAPSAA